MICRHIIPVISHFVLLFIFINALDILDWTSHLLDLFLDRCRLSQLFKYAVSFLFDLISDEARLSWAEVRLVTPPIDHLEIVFGNNPFDRSPGCSLVLTGPTCCHGLLRNQLVLCYQIWCWYRSNDFFRASTSICEISGVCPIHNRDFFAWINRPLVGFVIYLVFLIRQLRFLLTAFEVPRPILTIRFIIEVAWNDEICKRFPHIIKTSCGIRHS